MKRRLIGETFPVEKVSKESAREKSIRHGHISTLHLWWARRPLASSRATIYASLVDPPKDIGEWGSKNEQIAELSRWENSLNYDMISRVRKEILASNGGAKPKVLDPFGGGGSIPLEALRLGCETYSGDINPVAVLIQKCILEYPQKFGQTHTGKSMNSHQKPNRLLADIKKWSDWVLAEARKEIGKFYEEKDSDLTAVGYITARTIQCQNPQCGVEIPLIASYRFVNRPGKKICLYPHVDGKQVSFKIVGDGHEKIPDGFEPTKGTVSQGRAVCIACHTVVDPATLKSLFWKNRSWDKQLVTIIIKKGAAGKMYRLANQNADRQMLNSASKYLDKKRKELSKKLMIDPVPDEIMPTPENKKHVQGSSYWRDTKIMTYNMTKWNDLFNPRQTLAMIVFLEKLRFAHQQMLDNKYDEEYAKAVTTYLAFMLDKLAGKISNLAVYHTTGEKIKDVFGIQALRMSWDYVELNPFYNTGWPNIQDGVMKVVAHCSNIEQSITKTLQESATSLSYDDEYFDAVFTDPPYYDNIHYSIISDFFYVWLKRSVGHLHPELFATPLTPKSEEAVATMPLVVGIDKKIVANTIKSIKTKENFESTLSKSFSEIYRVLKKDGIVVIVYSHKSTDGWETLINSLLESGLVITGAWPIHTEMKARLVAKETAALSSSIYMVARKTKKEDLGFYRDIKKGMSERIGVKLQYLWNEGISGADFFISAIGTSMEVFGRYEKIVDDDDMPVTTPRLLDDVRKIVTDFAIDQVLHSEFGDSISHMTRFYILWRWTYGHARVPFDDALKMAQSVGIDIEREYGKIIHKDKGFISVLGPSDRRAQDIGAKEWIDILHKAVLLWKGNRRDQMVELLERAGVGGSEAFYKVAQAVSESAPGSDESKLLDGLLSGKNVLMRDAHQGNAQTKLF